MMSALLNTDNVLQNILRETVIVFQMTAIEFGPMALSIPQKDLGKIKKLSNQNNFLFITTFNPNNPNIYSIIKSPNNF